MRQKRKIIKINICSGFFKIDALKFPEFENPEKTKAVILNDQSSSEKKFKFKKELGTSPALFSRGVDSVFLS